MTRSVLIEAIPVGTPEDRGHPKMSEYTEEETPVGGGMTRRQFVTRSAVIGGMVWAAPAISTLGGRAFAAEHTPRDCVDISYLAVVITVGGTTYQFKVQSDEPCENAGETPHCPEPDGWEKTLVNNTGGCAYIGSLFLVDQSDPCCWSVTVTGTDDFELAGVAMGAGGTDSPSGKGFCEDDPTITNGGRKYVFCSGPTRNA